MFFDIKNSMTCLASKFWNNFHPCHIVEIIYKCEFDACPNYTTDEHYFCTIHQKEFENIKNGSQPQGK